MQQSISQAEIDTLLQRHRPGYALERPFYVDPALFEAEYEHIISRNWQYVDLIQRIPKRGDWFLFNIAGEQLVIIRGDGDTVHAHYNVCRHRGSRVCLESEGNNLRLTCPYHAWSYRIDGTLANARAMPDDFDPTQFALKSCRVRLFEGMIFVNLTLEDHVPLPEFDTIADALQPWLARAELRNTKIVLHETYSSNVNWKIALENYFECYHCVTSHPELSRVDLETLRSGVGTPAAIAKFEKLNNEWIAKATALGHKTGGITSTEAASDSEHYVAQSYYAVRQLIHYDMDEAYSNLDGNRPKQTSRLLGSYKEDDNGWLSWGVNPSVHMYTSCAYTVIYRITPISALETEMSQTWLVHKDAVEGIDYDVEDLTWLDRTTMTQDEKIVSDNQAGISSRTYEPGPFATLESEAAAIHNDYIRTMKVGRGLL